MTQQRTVVLSRDGGKVSIQVTSTEQADIKYQAPPASGITSVMTKSDKADDSKTVEIQSDTAALYLK